MSDPWAPSIQRLVPALVAIRRDLHRHPELGFREHRTQQACRAWLTDLGYAVRDCAGTGLIAELDETVPARIALRCDLDALPIHEHTPLSYRSVHDGVAHKCGHDGHTAILLGVASELARRRDLGVGVRLLFQPAEEGVDGGGAQRMLAQGALAGVEEVYGLHNWPGFEKGSVVVAEGPVMAQVDSLSIRITGRGGHASQPQQCCDPILAAAQVVSALQSIVARDLAPSATGVVSIASIHGGSANNVIPDRVTLEGTIRTLDPVVRVMIHERIGQIAAGVAGAMGASAEVSITPEFPVLVNGADCVARVRRAAHAALGADRCTSEGLPLMASEDFAFLAGATAGAFFFLGAGDAPGCHHPDFDFDDDLIAIGVRMFLGIVEDTVRDESAFRRR